MSARGKVVWIIVSNEDGIPLGGEWESRKRDAIYNAKHFGYSGMGDKGVHILRAVITPAKKKRGGR